MSPLPILSEIEGAMIEMFTMIKCTFGLVTKKYYVPGVQTLIVLQPLLRASCGKVGGLLFIN